MTSQEKREKLVEWIKSLDRAKLEKVARQAVEHMVHSEDVGFYPRPDDNYAEGARGPYWDCTGTELGEDE